MNPARTSLVALGLSLLANLADAKDSLVIGFAQFPASLHPYISAQTVQYQAVGFGNRPISTYDVTGARICLMCEELPTLEDGLAKIEDQPDGSKGLAVTLRLRAGLKWSDGAPVTSKDIEFTWQMARRPDAGFIQTYAWDRAKRLDIVDDRTVVLHLDRTYVTYQLWEYLIPEHIEGPIAAAAGPGGAMEYINHTLYNAAPTTPGLWNGPYVVSAYKSGDSIDFEPNPYWSGPAPGFKHITIRLIENTAALQANMLSGDIDMSLSGIGVTTDQAVQMEKTRGPFQFFYHNGLSYERITMNTQDTPMGDLRVRQAMLMAIDRKALIERLFFGHAVLALSWINGVDPLYTSDVAQYPFDPARARALLKEAGFTPGPDGVLRNEAGQRLSFEFVTTAGNRIREVSQAVMQNQWKAVGIDVRIQNQPSRVFFGELMRKRAYAGLTEWANSGRLGVPPSAYYGSTLVPTAANNFNGQNWSGWSNAEMDTLMSAAETELDPEKQKRLWIEMQKLYAANLPELPLYFRQDPDVVPAWLKGYDATGKEDYISYFAEKWHG